MFNRIPPVLLTLIGAIVLAQALLTVAPPPVQDSAVTALALFPDHWKAALAAGDLLALAPSMFGHVFLHGGWVHLAFNMVLLASVGRALILRLEQRAGSAWRFLLLFFGSAAAAGIAYVALNFDSSAPALGASGAACGVYAAYLMSVRANWRQSLRDPWVVQNGAMFLAVNVGLAFVVRWIGVLPIAWEAHLGGFVAGALLYPLVAPRSTFRAA